MRLYKLAFVLLSEGPLISFQLWIVRPPSRTIRSGPMSRPWVYLTSLILLFIPIRQPAVAIKGIQDPETRWQVLLSYHCHTYITRTCVVPVVFSTAVTSFFLSSQIRPSLSSRHHHAICCSSHLIPVGVELCLCSSCGEFLRVYPVNLP